MRVFISVDMEGIHGICSWNHVDPRKKEYERARRRVIEEVKAAILGARRAGATRIVVADSHDGMLNINAEELPEGVELVSGFPRPLCMVAGIWEGFDAAFLIGYHSRKGVRASTLDHTMSGRLIQRIVVNGEEVSELWLSAAVAGHYGVPVALVTGDEALVEHARRLLPGVEAVATKRALSRGAALLRHPAEVLREVERAAERAVEKARRGELKPFKPAAPLEAVIEFTESTAADLAEYIPGAERLDGLRVKYVAKDPVELYKVIELGLFLGIAARSLTA